MKRYELWTDDQEDSKKAEKFIKQKGIEYRVESPSTDGEWKFPRLFIPEGRIEGLTNIISYLETAYQ